MKGEEYGVHAPLLPSDKPVSDDAGLCEGNPVLSMHTIAKKLRLRAFAMASILSMMPGIAAAGYANIVNDVSVSASSGNGGTSNGSVFIQTTVNGVNVETIDRDISGTGDVHIEKKTELHIDDGGTETKGSATISDAKEGIEAIPNPTPNTTPQNDPTSTLTHDDIAANVLSGSPGSYGKTVLQALSHFIAYVVSLFT